MAKKYRVLGIEGEEVKIGEQTFTGRQPELIELSAADAEQALADSKVEYVEGEDEESSVETSGVAKSKYKVLAEGVEFPTGTAVEVGSELELTDEEASAFAEGQIEKVEQTQ